MIQSSRSLAGLQWRRRVCFLTLAITAASLLSPAAGAARKKKSKALPKIRTVQIEPKNVFDPGVPGENHWPFLWANVLHMRTRRHVIRQALLVKPGDPADPDLLDESERILRALPFIKDAKITEIPTPDGRVDLEVQTQDTWTAEPQINFATAGEQDHFALGYLERNLLGYGKTVSYFYRTNPDGVSREYEYTDPQVLGSRVQFSSLFDDTPTGREQHITLARPFYSLQTEAASGATWNHILGLQKVITNGVETNRYDRNHHDVDAFAGIRANRDPLYIHRLNLHYQYRTDFFSADPATAPGSLPNDKTFSGPLLTWNFTQVRFIKETFADKAGRIEDINLGHQAGVALGYDARLMASTNNTVPFSVIDGFGFGNEQESFGLLNYGLTGCYSLYAPRETGGRLTNTLYFASANYYKHMPVNFPLTGVAHLESAYAQDIDVENQLQLGGDTGLRGFKVQAFTGNKTILANLEARAYYPKEIFSLAYLGGAAFVDAGEAEALGDPFSANDAHASVGIGVRVGTTRSTEGTVYRFDVAYALGPIQQANRIVFSLAVGQGFQRSANAYAKFPDVPSTH